ncbi:uncharacterized protein [Leptinotarsa decemlineata]|uniref:uncharacterized protein n=1 Tax=Leptinotarsa decemlineata TaxID=7539 RepID=UPI003D3072F9
MLSDTYILNVFLTWITDVSEEEEDVNGYNEQCNENSQQVSFEADVQEISDEAAVQEISDEVAVQEISNEAAGQEKSDEVDGQEKSVEAADGQKVGDEEESIILPTKIMKNKSCQTTNDKYCGTSFMVVHMGKFMKATSSAICKLTGVPLSFCLGDNIKVNLDEEQMKIISSVEKNGGGGAAADTATDTDIEETANIKIADAPTPGPGLWLLWRCEQKLSTDGRRR